VSASSRFRSQPRIALSAIAAAALLAACGKEAPKVEDVRPVRTMTVAPSTVDIQAEFAGDVRARVESRLGFRVGGKVVARKVDPGTVVRKGQVLMQLDPQDLQLGAAQANASLRAAETNAELAKADLKRYQELYDKNFISRAILDAKIAANKAAAASVDSARAASRNLGNQASYANLVSDIDGVVTAVEADVGQVVAPGAPVVRVAASAEKEVVIGIPEDKVDTLRSVEDVAVRLWAAPDAALKGKVREISPIADPTTRTYTVKVAVPQAPAAMKLGMTANVQFTSTLKQPQMKLPLTALVNEQGKTAVWVVDKGAVKLTPIVMAGPSGNEIVVATGIQPGQQVVTAGVNMLKNGQKVKILGQEMASNPGVTK
jgi:RND family efflux transporter MFP subunit